MEKFGKSQSVERREDDRFLTGTGRYVDDTAPMTAMYGYVFRSPYAHGVIKFLDVEAAEAAAGVHLVLTAKVLEDAGIVGKMEASLLKNQDGQNAPNTDRLLLAKDKVRFVGEPVAMVVAESLAQARAAVELIWLEIDDLPTHMEVRPGGTPLHDKAPNNVAFDWATGDIERMDAVKSDAAHLLSFEITDNRIICNSMEPRGCWADLERGRLHLCVNGQGVWAQKTQLANMFGLSESEIRVTNPDVGGGFGMKAMSYPEYFLVAQATLMLGKPVRWMSERSEAMLSDNAGRDLTSTATLTLNSDFKITGYQVQTFANMGAYSGQFAQPIQTQLFSKVLTGLYDIPVAHLQVTGVYTNTTQVDAYRGAGRPEAIYVLERAMDYAARSLGIDPWDFRRQNFIPANSFPYKTASNVRYDVGDFHQVLDKVIEKCDLAGFEKRRADSTAKGLLRGMGLCCYIESILGNPTETSRVVFNKDGTLDLFVGTQSNGQGHETVYAQYLSDQTGLPVEKINIIQGDSDKIPTGGGTGGSRSATVQNTATLALVRTLTERYAEFLGQYHDVEVTSVTFDDEVFRLGGSNVVFSLMDAADLARIEGKQDLLDITQSATLDDLSFPNGAHVAEVEIDPETGQSNVVRYVIVDDFGYLLNPMLVEGQVHGGVVQGLGQAMMEHVVYDENGQLLTASFMDYGMPRASDVPMFEFNSVIVPSTANPIGMKGCGEAGTIGSMAAVSNAMMDALAVSGVTQADMPFTPQRVWNMLQSNL